MGILHPLSTPDPVAPPPLSNFRSSGIGLVLWVPVWVAWPYSVLFVQSQASKNKLRVEADMDHQDQDGARTGREHGGKKTPCFLITGMKVSILLLQPLPLSYHFILQPCALQILAHTLKIKTHTIVNFILIRLWNIKALTSVHGHRRNVQILYIHIISSSKTPTSHCQMLFFAAGLPEEWRRIFHQWATFLQSRKKASNTFIAF